MAAYPGRDVKRLLNNPKITFILGKPPSFPNFQGGPASGKGAAGGFWLRQMYFLALALYSSCAVAAFDAFWPGKQKCSDA